MREVLSTLRSLFSNEVNVALSPSVVTLECDGSTVTVPADVYVVHRGSESFISGVGHPPAAGVPGQRVPIFEPRYRDSTGLPALAMLSAFFKVAIKQLPARRKVVRPFVRVTGLRSLQGWQSGELESLVRSAVLAAGAHRCEFVARHGCYVV